MQLGIESVNYDGMQPQAGGIGGNPKGGDVMKGRKK